MKFPLGLGHRFGVNPYDISVHDGKGSKSDHAGLEAVQRHLILAWGFGDVRVTGVWDGPTQEAVAEVQRNTGKLITANLDEDTWQAAFNRKAPETALESTQSEQEAPTPTEVPSEEEPAPEPSEPVVAVRKPPGRPRKKV